MKKLELIRKINELHAARLPNVSTLEARIESYELAYRMQSSAPEAVDLSRETAETIELYGLNDKQTESFGKICLLARRMVERGVRFIQLFSGTGSGWDAHSEIEVESHQVLRQRRSADRGTADRISTSWICSSRLWSFGAASLAARR